MRSESSCFGDRLSATSVRQSIASETSSKVVKQRNKLEFPAPAISLSDAEFIVASNGGCCKKGKNCFIRHLKQPDAGYVVMLCRQELTELNSRTELIDRLREKVYQCMLTVREHSEYAEMEYKIIPEKKCSIVIPSVVCYRTFMKAWGINKHLLSNLRDDVKENFVRTVRGGSRRLPPFEGDVAEMLKSSGVGIVLSPERLRLASMPQSEASSHCNLWMENYFQLCGDFQPNTGEIHLDPVKKCDIYEEYVSETEPFGLPVVSLSRFKRMWKKDFPLVKIRKYKACTGKCLICVELLVQTRKSRNVKVLEYVRACRLIHRTDFMKDRSLYDARRGFAAKKPKEALSLITDGMQQTHCELPYSANRYPHSNKLKQHLQGITCHGRRTKMYRTFDNLPLGSNLCIYTLLYEIEEELKMNGCLPKILYIQIDGGSENANYAVLAWMEILIWLDVGVEEIWVCRMRTGHNHADQDAKFGIVWRTARTRVLLTPQHYEKMIAEALKSECVVDIMAVPDLVGAVESFVDPSLRHAFKGVYTQHVFRFQKAPISSRFPLGARCTYRASALDYFYEFVNNPLSPIGISPRKVMVEWQPEDGIRFMTSAPPFDFLDHIQTQEFVEGSTRKMRNIVHMIKSSNTKSRNDYNIHVERDYNEFLEGIPLSEGLGKGRGRKCKPRGMSRCHR